MTKAERLKEYGEVHPDLLTADGFDEAILGIVDDRWGSGEMRVVYDRKIITETLMKQGMSEEEALEYFEFNIEGAYVGGSTPLFMEVFA